MAQTARTRWYPVDGTRYEHFRAVEERDRYASDNPGERFRVHGLATLGYHVDMAYEGGRQAATDHAERVLNWH